MLWAVFVALLTLWELGIVSSFNWGGFINLLILVAVVALVFQLITSRSPA